VALDPPRPFDQRKQDTLARFTGDVDAWVASADASGGAYLVPLSFLWDGQAFTIVTPEASRTARNVRSSGRARLGFGPTRDVVLVDAVVETFTLETVPGDVESAFAARFWNAREDADRHVWLRVTPERIQAWREVNELPGRLLMRDGRWLG
jgi:Pyridoxamine 5'-phosphate oxidase